VITTAGVVLTGDVPLVATTLLAEKLHASIAGLSGQILTVMLNRPASLILLVMSIFYLWIYLRRAPNPAEADTGGSGKM
jgi:hypothetical protein